MEIVYRFLDKIRQIRGVLQSICEFHIFDKSGTNWTLDLIRKLIAIVEALSKCLYLIAVTCKTYNVFSTVVLKIEHKLLLRIVECYSHIIKNRLQRYNVFARNQRITWKICYLSSKLLLCLFQKDVFCLFPERPRGYDFKILSVCLHY